MWPGNAHRARPKNILFVINTPAAGSDVTIQSMLTNDVGDLTGAGNANNNVTVIDDSAAGSTPTAGFDLIVVSQSVTSATVGTAFQNTDVPVVLTESALLSEMNMGPDGAVAGAATQMNLTSSRFDPLSGTTTVSSAGFNAGYLTTANLPAGATSLATIVGQPTQHCCFMFEKEATGSGGFSMPERRVFLGYSGDLTMTANGQTVLRTLCELGLYLR
jgi:hypothetical protein